MEAQHTPKQRWNRRLTLYLVAGLVVGIALVVGVAGSFKATCSLCHRVQTVAVTETAHSSVTCYQCHLTNGAWSIPRQKADEVLGMYPKAIVGAGYRGPVTQTSRAACLKCHTSILEGVSASGGLRINHSTCAAGSTCDTCHSTVAHPGSTRWVGSPVMEDCIACHQQKSASVECSTCHTGDRKRSAAARGPWQVTHGKDWRKTHGMGQIDSCSTCHPKDFCTKCHKVRVPHPVEFGSTHGQLAIDDSASCEACHKFRRFCDSCHGIAMPHPAGFLKQHPTLSRGTHDSTCLRCHTATDCDNCHANHVHPGGSKGVPVPWTYTQGAPK